MLLWEALLTGPAAPSLHKVHSNPIGTAKGRVAGVGTDGQCGNTRAELALGFWVHGELVGTDT